MGATLPNSPRPELLMALCCGNTLELLGTTPGAHSGCPLLPHGELSRSGLVIGVNREIRILMLDLEWSHGSFETKPELTSPCRQLFRNDLCGTGYQCRDRTRTAHLSHSVLSPGTHCEVCLSWLQPALPCLPRDKGFPKCFFLSYFGSAKRLVVLCSTTVIVPLD